MVMIIISIKPSHGDERPKSSKVTMGNTGNTTPTYWDRTELPPLVQRPRGQFTAENGEGRATLLWSLVALERECGSNISIHFSKVLYLKKKSKSWIGKLLRHTLRWISCNFSPQHSQDATLRINVLQILSSHRGLDLGMPWMTLGPGRTGWDRVGPGSRWKWCCWGHFLKNFLKLRTLQRLRASLRKVVSWATGWWCAGHLEVSQASLGTTKNAGFILANNG